MSVNARGDSIQRGRLAVIIAIILWMVVVFGWVLLYGEAYIGPNADSAAFMARLVEFQ